MVLNIRVLFLRIVFAFFVFMSLKDSIEKIVMCMTTAFFKCTIGDVVLFNGVENNIKIKKENCDLYAFESDYTEEKK